jgi:phosphate transport system substrate-binding protein
MNVPTFSVGGYMKKTLKIILYAVICLTICAACGSRGNFNPNSEINVISRNTGSGTRNVFIEIFEIQAYGIDPAAPRDAANSTNAVIANVAEDVHGIGYIAMGSLNESVRAISIDGASPAYANIRLRPFYIVIQDEVNPLRDDFINFILSARGQSIAASSHAPAGADFPAFSTMGLPGTLAVGGSTSIYPLMSRLAEAYGEISGVNVEVWAMDSSMGISLVLDDMIDMGMSGRGLTAAELASLEAITMAYDGLVVIVHPDNPLENLTSEQVRLIFEGEITRWNEIIE